MSKTVTVVGLGYVGLPLAMLASSKGYKTYGIDVDKSKIKNINDKIDPLNDEYITDRIKLSKVKGTDSYDSVKDSEIIIICVPTPIKDGYLPDLVFVEKATESVAKNLSKKSLIIIESTINPGVCDEVVIPLIECVSGKKLNKDFYVAHCPERINPGDKTWSVENIPRVVGASNPKGLEIAVSFYTNIVDANIKQMGSIKEAEAVKVVENSFRDVNIAFVNELAMSFTKLGIDVKNVIDGAATKPFAFMPHYPGVGVGGHCIPVDPYYLIEYAKGFGFNHEFLSIARSINNQMPAFALERLIDGLNEVKKPLKGSRVLVLGLSYKPNVADDRESPSYKLLELLKEKGAIATAYDPYVVAKSDHKNLDESLKDVDAIAVATNHNEFKNLPQKIKNVVLLDGKNMFKASDFEGLNITYRGIGT